MTIQTIQARLESPNAGASDKGLYCFDSEEHGLVSEPFVETATTAIHCGLRWFHGFDHFVGSDGTYRMSPAVELRFTDDQDDCDRMTGTGGVVTELTLVAEQDGGYVYDWEIISPESAVEYQHEESLIFCDPAWLCPALLHYFPAGAPKRMWLLTTESKAVV